MASQNGGVSDPNLLGSEWYKQAFDEATVAMGFIDSGWRLVRANEAICKMFGYPSAELLGKSILELTHPDDVGRTAEKLGKVFAGTSGGYRIEKRYITKSGDTIWGLVSTFPVKDEGGKVVYCFGVIEDITHAKKLEAALKESELLYHALVELSPDGIAVHAGGKILFVNQAGAKMLGAKKAEEIIGKPTMSFVHPDSQPLVVERIKKMLEENKPVPLIAEKFVRLDGSVIDVEVAASPILYQGKKAVQVVIHDITETKRIGEGFRLLGEVTRAVGEAVDFSGALEAMLRIVCASVGWVYGEAWLQDPVKGVLYLSPSWFTVDKKLSSFRELTLGATFKPGDGLPGRVFLSKKAEWLSDVSVNGRFFPRAKEALAAKIRAGLGVPIVADDQVLAVVVFFATEVRKEEKGLIDIVSSLGTQLGLVFRRKQVEEALRVSESRYRSLAEAAHDMIFVLDRTGTITYVNSFAAEQFGLRPEDMVGRRRAEFFGPAAETQDISLGKVFESGKPLYRETRTPFKDKMLWLGTWLVPLVENGKEVTGILGVSRDISVQKEAELELMRLNRTLRESEESYHGLFDSVAEAIYIQDREGKFLDVNPGAVRMYGHPREWFIGRSPLDVAAPGKNDLKKIGQAVERAFAGEPAEFEFWGVRSNGEVFPKDVRLYQGKYFGQEVVIALATDITERKERERQRDEFVMIASHELRAPMTAIRWQISMMLDGTYGPIGDRLRDSLAGMMISADRLIELVNDMISTSRIEGGGLKLAASDFDIKKMLADLTGTFSSEVAKKGLAFDLSGVKSVSVHADVDKTAQILSNLVDNAIKFTDDGGKISLGVGVAGDRVRITVADTGIGIPPDFNDKLFGKFAQAVTGREGKLRGTGLGLYISRELARTMGGDLILVESQVGKGSIFALILPAAAGKPTPTAKPA